MAPPQPAQSVVQHSRGITATLWFACRASKAQCPADVDKWQARCRGSARRHGDAKSCWVQQGIRDRKSTRLNSSHSQISYAVFCLKKKKKKSRHTLCTP